MQRRHSAKQGQRGLIGKRSWQLRESAAENAGEQILLAAASSFAIRNQYSVVVNQIVERNRNALAGAAGLVHAIHVRNYPVGACFRGGKTQIVARPVQAI